LTQGYLKKILKYQDGLLYWKEKRNGINSTYVAGVKTAKKGFWRIGINGKKYYCHDIIYLMHYGFVPKNIKHIDGNKANNQLCNLQEDK
jgi:hypothetical protein